MNPSDAESAHRIVAEYVAVLERGSDQPLPASVRLLPYPKQTIKAAILTCAAALAQTEQLTSEMRDFLEQAYVALADYVDEDVVQVMTEYRDSLAAVAAVQTARDKVQMPAWQRVTEISALAGDIARSIAEDAAALRLEFHAHYREGAVL